MDLLHPDPDKPKPNVLEIAKKKRYIFLLEKIQTGKTLSGPEYRELKEIEGVNDLPVGIVKDLAQVAKAFKVSHRSAQNWARDGMPRTPEGYYDLTEIQSWRLLKDRRRTEDGITAEEWKLRYIKSKAQIADAEYQKMMGELVPLSEIEAERVPRILALKRAFLGLPKRIIPQLLGLEPRQQVAVMEKRIKEILNDFAEGFR